MDENSAIEWNSYMREVYSVHLTQTFNDQISGDNEILETDKSLFVCRMKKKKKTAKEDFEGICRENGKCFLVQIEILVHS